MFANFLQTPNLNPPICIRCIRPAKWMRTEITNLLREHSFLAHVVLNHSKSGTELSAAFRSFAQQPEIQNSLDNWNTSWCPAAQDGGWRFLSRTSAWWETEWNPHSDSCRASSSRLRTRMKIANDSVPEWNMEDDSRPGLLETLQAEPSCCVAVCAAQEWLFWRHVIRLWVYHCCWGDLRWGGCQPSQLSAWFFLFCCVWACCWLSERPFKIKLLLFGERSAQPLLMLMFVSGFCLTKMWSFFHISRNTQDVVFRKRSLNLDFARTDKFTSCGYRKVH